MQWLKNKVIIGKSISRLTSIDNILVDTYIIKLSGGQKCQMTIRLHHDVEKSSKVPCSLENKPQEVPGSSFSVSNQTDFGIKSNQLNQVHNFHDPSSLNSERFEDFEKFKHLNNPLTPISEGSKTFKLARTGHLTHI